MKDAQPEEDGGVDDVEISKVNSDCLAKVVEFLKHHQTEPMTEIKTPLEDNTFEGVVKQEWYRAFVTGIDRSLLFELLMAANFMSVREYGIFPVRSLIPPIYCSPNADPIRFFPIQNRFLISPASKFRTNSWAKVPRKSV